MNLCLGESDNRKFMPNNEKCRELSEKYRGLLDHGLRFKEVYSEKRDRAGAMAQMKTIERDIDYLKSKTYKIGLGDARDFINPKKLKDRYFRGSELSMIRDGLDVQMIFSDYLGSDYYFALFKKKTKLYIMLGNSEQISDSDEASGFTEETDPLGWLNANCSTAFSFYSADQVAYFLRRIKEVRKKMTPAQQIELMRSLGVKPDDVAWQNLFDK